MIMYPVDPRTLSHLQHLTISPRFAGGAQLGLAAGRVVGFGQQQLLYNGVRPASPPSDPTLSDRKIDEYRRSLFIPDVPKSVAIQHLSATFRLFGNIQEIFQRDNSNSAVVVFVEGESAFDALKARVVVNNFELFCEPRRINGRLYPPEIPMDVETPARVQTQTGGRGIPYSIVANLPTVSGSVQTNTSNEASYGRPDAARAPFLQPQFRAGLIFTPRPNAGLLLTPRLEDGLLPTPQANTFANILPNQPLPLQRSVPPKHESNIQKLLRQMPFLSSTNDPVHQMIALMRNVELNAEDYRLREQIRSQLEQSFRKIFRRCDLRMYGSSVNTFGIRGSDIDSFLELYLDSDEAQKEFQPRERNINYYNNNITQLFSRPYEPGELNKYTKQQILKLMERLQRYLAKSFGWDNILSVPEARTPILKLHQNYTNMSVDVSFSSKLVFQNTGLLILYSMMDNRVRPVVYTIRKWADTKELTGDVGFTKYALTVLLLFFFFNTTPVVLHTPEQIIAWIESTDDSKNVPGGSSPENRHPFSFDVPPNELERLARSIPASLNQRSPAQLLMDFFAFYASFDFPSNVMSTFTGEVIPVQSFEVPPDGFRFRYVNIQDPFDMAHNIAKSVSMHTFITMREWMRQEVAVFSKIPLSLITLFDKDYSETCLPAIPVMVSISAHKSKVPFAEWTPKVADLTKRIFEDFFRCEFVRELSEGDTATSANYDRAIPHVGPILSDFHCQLKCRSWDKRRNLRKTALKGKKLAGLKDEWSLESTIGDLLQKQTFGRISLDFYVTVMENKCDSDKVCLFLTSEKRSEDIGEFFELLWKYLPDQIRRFLKLDDVAVQTVASLSGESTAEETQQKAEDREVGA